MLASKKPTQGLTVRELDGSPTVAATVLVLPNGTLNVSGTEATVSGVALLTANTFTAKQSFSGVDHVGLCLNSLTTAQYNALTPANGDLFRDSTTDRIDARLARGTVELVDTAGGQTINGALAATNLTGINTGDQNIYAASAESRSKKLRIIAGVVRPTRSGTSLTWNWISDTDHAPVGFGSISSTSAHLILNFDATYGKAITCFVLPDEFYQKYGFQCGVSLGLSAMTVTMTANFNSVTSYSHNGTSWSNAGSSSGNFVTAVSVSGNITTLTLADYGAGGAASQFSHSIPIYHGSNNRYARMVNSGLGVNQVRFELIDPATGTAQAPARGAQRLAAGDTCNHRRPGR